MSRACRTAEPSTGAFAYLREEDWAHDEQGERVSRGSLILEDPPIWLERGGKQTPVCVMSDTHLRNARGMLARVVSSRGSEDYWPGPDAGVYLDALDDEIRRRGLGPAPVPPPVKKKWHPWPCGDDEWQAPQDSDEIWGSGRNR